MTIIRKTKMYLPDFDNRSVWWLDAEVIGYVHDCMVTNAYPKNGGTEEELDAVQASIKVPSYSVRLGIIKDKIRAQWK